MTTKKRPRKRPTCRPPKTPSTPSSALHKSTASRSDLSRCQSQQIFHRCLVAGEAVVSVAAAFSLTDEQVTRTAGRLLLDLAKPAKTALERLAPARRARLATRLYQLRLAYLWQQALQAWQLSLVEQQTAKQTAADSGERFETTTRPQTGDARYLQFAWRMAQEIVQLEGGPIPFGEAAMLAENNTIQQPSFQEQSDVGQLSDEQRRAVAAKLLDEIREQLATDPAFRALAETASSSDSPPERLTPPPVA